MDRLVQLLDTPTFTFLFPTSHAYHRLMCIYVTVRFTCIICLTLYSHLHTDGPPRAVIRHPHLHIPTPSTAATSPACFPAACTVCTSTTAATEQCIPPAQHATAGEGVCVCSLCALMWVRVGKGKREIKCTHLCSIADPLLLLQAMPWHTLMQMDGLEPFPPMASSAEA